MERVLASVLEPIWDRLIPGGILILDHFNHESSPTESDLLISTVGSAKIEQFQYSRSPTAVIQKPFEWQSVSIVEDRLEQVAQMFASGIALICNNFST